MSWILATGRENCFVHVIPGVCPNEEIKPLRLSSWAEISTERNLDVDLYPAGEKALKVCCAPKQFGDVLHFISGLDVLVAPLSWFWAYGWPGASNSWFSQRIFLTATTVLAIAPSTHTFSQSSRASHYLGVQPTNPHYFGLFSATIYQADSW